MIGVAFLLDEIAVLAFPRSQPITTVRLSYLGGDVAVLGVLI